MQLSIAVGGSSLDRTIAFSGQTVRLIFVGTVGQNLGLGIHNLTLSPSTSLYLSYTIYQPNGNQVTSGNCWVSDNGCGLNLSNLPATGTYTVVLTPYLGGTGSFTATLSSEVTGTLSVGTPTTVTLTRPGQNGRFTFLGGVGQQLGLTLSGVTITGVPAGKVLKATIYKPDGVALQGLDVTNAATAILDLPALPVSGTYTVFVDPPLGATASLNVLLTADVLAPLTVDGAPTDVTIPLTGQTARLSFSATAGQNLGLGITNLALSPSGSGYVSLVLYRPNGTVDGPHNCNVALTQTCVTPSLLNLPATGTYTVVVTPQAGGTGSFTATLSSEVTGTLAVGTPTTVTIPRPGQNGRFTFVGTAGQRSTLTFSSVTTNPAGTAVTVTVYRTDTGASVKTLSITTATATLTIDSLPVTGTYALFVDPSSYATASMDVLLGP